MNTIWEDWIFPLLLSIAAVGAIILVLVISSKYYNESKNNDIEAECFYFYKQNNYVLDKCSAFEDKLKR